MADVGVGVWPIVLAAVLAEMNPPISTTQAPSPHSKGRSGSLRGSASDWSAPWWSPSRPANRIGWIMSGITLVVGLSLFADEYSRFALVTDPGTWPLGGPTAWMRDLGIPPPVVALVMTLVVMYPSGDPSRLRPMDPSSIPLHHLGGRCGLCLPPRSGAGRHLPDNPLGLPGLAHLLDPATEWLSTILAVIALVAIVDLVIRFRRSSGVERMQFRWFVLAVAPSR